MHLRFESVHHRRLRDSIASVKEEVVENFVIQAAERCDKSTETVRPPCDDVQYFGTMVYALFSVDLLKFCTDWF